MNRLRKTKSVGTVMAVATLGVVGAYFCACGSGTGTGSGSGSDSTDEMACSGTWTDGSSALGGSGGTSTTSSTTTGTATCSSSSSPGLCCPANYCTLGSAHGYEFAYSDSNDGGTSYAQITEAGRLCVTGNAGGIVCDPTSASCYSSHWGAGIGVNLNQANGTGTTPASFSAALVPPESPTRSTPCPGPCEWSSVIPRPTTVSRSSPGAAGQAGRSTTGTKSLLFLPPPMKPGV
jgi:hypothetical protein